MKKLLAMTLFVCTLFALSLPASAVDITSDSLQPPVDYGEPIQETTFYDEDLDATIVSRTYFAPDPISAHSEKSGEGWYKKEDTYWWNGGTTMSTTYYAEGYFKWGDGDVSVTNPRGGYDDMHASGLKTFSTSKDSGTGKFAGLFTKYAYVEYKISYTTKAGIDGLLSVRVRVNENGKVS